MEQYAFVFDDSGKAKRFVERLAHHLRDVAIFRDGAEVNIIDGAESQREEIYRLAKASSASYSIKIDIP